MGSRERPVLLVEDGMPGGVQRATDYLVHAWDEARRDGEAAPSYERLYVRGTGSLTASVFVYARALGSIASRLAMRRVRVLHLNLTQRGSTARAMPLVALATVARTPVVIHLHSSQYDSFVHRLPRPARAALRWTFRRAGRVIVLGDGWAELVERELGVSRDRVVVLRNAVPGPATLPRREPDPDEGVRILFLGQLGERKGVPDLIDALGRPEVASLRWRLTLAGDGDQRPYRQRARRRGIEERLDFIGWVDQSDVADLLRDSDILVLPSRAEGMPLSVLEGLAWGLAAVVTPVGAVPEVITSGTNGLLVTPGDAPALAAALAHLVADPDLRGRLGAAGHATWREHHSVAQHARRIADLYEDVAPSGSAGPRAESAPARSR